VENGVIRRTTLGNNGQERDAWQFIRFASADMPHVAPSNKHEYTTCSQYIYSIATVTATMHSLRMRNKQVARLTLKDSIKSLHFTDIVARTFE
jgi:hypothetical protein